MSIERFKQDLIALFACIAKAMSCGNDHGARRATPEDENANVGRPSGRLSP